ncbi:3-oxoacyl-ACP reductase [Oceanicola sp. 22II-s10i]|uniref:SDR family NAD(P)-dependent oxidoreductase n=1 Tax=Oceanicola sp. 22II-s10i TaxID=1317116 RepID=UPI000B51F7A2|nr:SDR family oxidoreductase [Oceanicola sp. 22II-s10i]OWU83047.1 3-oxoacyl-ACP reductase [Oceanicola sp. 22II-s10i]
MTGRIQDKVALVIGAGSIGEAPSNGSATALLFATEGATVMCVDISEPAAARTVAQIEAVGGTASTFRADVADTAQIDAAVAACMERYGRIDILHYNVGIEAFGELIDVTDESWDRVFDINLKGAMAAARAAVPHMIAQGGGSIINVSSIASLRWSPMQFLSYNVSKAALNRMTRVVARQYAPHKVRCNVILPGLIDSPHAAALVKTEAERIEAKKARDARCPMGHQGTPQDIAMAALFLASEESRYVTGLEMVVDGGITL